MHKPTCVDSNPSRGQSAYEMDRTQSDPPLTGKRRAGALTSAIVAFACVAAVTSVIVVVLYVLAQNGTTEPPPATTEPPPTTTDPPPTTTEPSPEIPIKLALLKEPVLMNFAMAKPETVTQLDIFHGNVRLSSVNVTGNDTVSAGPRMLVDIQTSIDSFRVTLTLLNVTCSDEGIYAVVARSDDTEERKLVNLTVFRRPDLPVLEIPNHIVESKTTADLVCRVSSLGYPPLKLAWILRRPNGSNQTFPGSSHMSADADACQSVGNSTLDVQGYSGWNNSDICCQLKEPKSSAVYFESCQHLLTVPEDYCSSGDDLMLYPYEPCYTYVQCQGGVVSFKSCPAQNGFCFNVTSQNCSAPPSEPPTNSPAIPTNPFDCTRQSARYVPSPDTYPDNCHKFQRCVEDAPVEDSCGSGLEFSYDENGDQDIVCGLPSDVTYCGKRFLQENVTVFWQNLTARPNVGGNVSLECVMTHITRLEIVRFLHEDTEVASLNVTDLSKTSFRNNVDVAGEERDEGRGRRFVATLTVSNLSCSDGGVYVCVAENGEHEARQTTTLQLTSLPNELILKIPDAAEGVTGVNPTCKVTSSGHDPTITFTWVLKRPNGSDETLATYRANNSYVIKNDSTCSRSIETTLDAKQYAGWNNSELCCQVTHHDTAVVVKKVCQRMLLVSGDYCPSNVKTNKVHPYDPCDKWVQCVNGTEYINNCGGTGLCYDIATNKCL